MLLDEVSMVKETILLTITAFYAGIRDSDVSRSV